MSFFVYLVSAAVVLAAVHASAPIKETYTDFCQFPGVRYARNPEDPDCSYRSCFPAGKGQKVVIRCPPGTKIAESFRWSSDSGYAASAPCSEKDSYLETCYFSANIPGRNTYVSNMKKMEKYAEDQKYAKAPTHEDYAAQKKQQPKPVEAYYPPQTKDQPKEVKEQTYYTKEATYNKPEEPRYQAPAEQYPPQQESYQPPREEKYQPRGYEPAPNGRYYQREMTYNREYRPYDENIYQGRRGHF